MSFYNASLSEVKSAPTSKRIDLGFEVFDVSWAKAFNNLNDLNELNGLNREILSSGCRVALNDQAGAYARLDKLVRKLSRKLVGCFPARTVAGHDEPRAD